MSNSYYFDIEGFDFGATSMGLNGTDARDEIYTGSSKATVYGQGGNDKITVMPADNATPTGLTAADVIINGEAGDDEIVAHRAATINGGADNDTITGSYAKDIITGGAGNDIINAGGGSEMFKEQPNGIDRIDAGYGEGDIDTFWSDQGKYRYDFRLTGERFEELGIRFTGTDGTDELRFINLEKVSFYVNYYSNETINVSSIIQVLNADADHYMTGTELGAALYALNQPRMSAMRMAATDDVAMMDADMPSSSHGDVIYDIMDPDTLDFTGVYLTAPTEDQALIVSQDPWTGFPVMVEDTSAPSIGWDSPYDPIENHWGQMSIAPFHGDYIM